MRKVLSYLRMIPAFFFAVLGGIFLVLVALSLFCFGGKKSLDEFLGEVRSEEEERERGSQMWPED